jgi:hypothetical protein
LLVEDPDIVTIALVRSFADAVIVPEPTLLHENVVEAPHSPTPTVIVSGTENKDEFEEYRLTVTGDTTLTGFMLLSTIPTNK